MAHDNRPGSVAQLRDRIDKGLTGDKVAASDPAAAPLGTDDEAAGFSPAANGAAAAEGQPEARPAARRPTIAANATKPSERSGARIALMGIAAVMVVLALAIIITAANTP